MGWKLPIMILIAYLLGCLNGAIMVSRVFKHEDVRTKGSGNAGLTNFLRNYGGAVSFLVIAVDVCKVLLSGWIALRLCPEKPELAKMIAGISAMVGHMFPVFFGFRGGKGILSGAALAGMMDWRVLLIGVSCFFLVFLLTHYVSLGSILGAVAFSVSFACFFRESPVIYILGVLIAVLAIYMHRGNIQRLMQGCERKTYLKKSKNKE